MSKLRILPAGDHKIMREGCACSSTRNRHGSESKPQIVHGLTIELLAEKRTISGLSAFYYLPSVDDESTRRNRLPVPSIALQP